MPIKNVFVSIPYAREFLDVYSTIKAAGEKASDEHHDVELDLFSSFGPTPSAVRRAKGGLIINSIYDKLTWADLVITDISDQHPSVMYELGYAHAKAKPAIIIGQDASQIPFDIVHRRVITYDRSQLNSQLLPRLAEAITMAVRHPEDFAEIRERTEVEKNPPKAFVSYSHADKESLSRLQVHLKPLERAGLVDVWADTRIKAGQKWKEQIAEALNNAAIAILLISADFLASDFIVDDELPPLLAAAEERGTTILPVILKPCRFERDDSLSRFQAINAPSEPLLKLDEIDQEEIYHRVAERIEREIRSRMPS